MEIDETYDSFTLDNDFKLHYKNRDSAFIEGVLRVRHGSIVEEEGEEGLYHFLEHLLMTGENERYNVSSVKRRRADILVSNAETNYKSMNFPFQMFGEVKELDEYLSLLSSAIFEPKFDSESIERERVAIKHEVENRHNQLFYEEHKKLIDVLRGQDAQSNYDVGGKIESIDSFKKEDFRRIHDRVIFPDNMELILVGKIPENIEEMVERYFSKYEKGNVNEIELTKYDLIDGQHIQLRPDLRKNNSLNPEKNSSPFELIFNGVDITNADKSACSVVGSLLEERVYDTIREELGLAYDIHADFNCNRYGGFFTVKGEVRYIDVSQALDSILDIFEELRTELIDEEKLSTIKKHFKNRVLSVFESNSNWVSLIGSKEDYNLDVKKVIEDIEKVTPEDIRTVAQKYLLRNLKDDNFSLVVESVPDLEEESFFKNNYLPS